MGVSDLRDFSDIGNVQRRIPDGFSVKARVLSVIVASKFFGSFGETNFSVIPKDGRMASNIVYVPP